MTEKHKWTPRPSDVQWTRQLIDTLNDGGWAIPMNGSIWVVDKKNCVLRCMVGTKADLFDRVTACCEQIGYTTVLAADPATETTDSSAN